jgi:DNA-binding HxlR family transcriptional regulator
MAQKRYRVHCATAAGLDLVGDRWTLLILRELSFGEQRFTDLKNALPGVASNLLTERLGDLAGGRLIERRELRTPAARIVYALTPEGERIRPVLAALERFGMPYLGGVTHGQVRPRRAVEGTLVALFDPAQAAGRDLLLRFELDGEELWLQVRDGTIGVAACGINPDLVFEGSSAALVDLCRGWTNLSSADPRLVVTGSADARGAFERMFLGTAPHALSD